MITIRIFVFALITTPIIYALGVVFFQAFNVPADYGEGRILLAFSFFLAIAIGRLIFKSDNESE